MEPVPNPHELPFGPLTRYDHEQLSIAVFYDRHSPLGQIAVKRGLDEHDYERLRFQRDEPGLNLKSVFGNMLGALKRSGGISGEAALAAPEDSI